MSGAAEVAAAEAVLPRAHAGGVGRGAVARLARRVGRGLVMAPPAAALIVAGMLLRGVVSVPDGAERSSAGPGRPPGELPSAFLPVRPATVPEGTGGYALASADAVQSGQAAAGDFPAYAAVVRVAETGVRAAPDPSAPLQVTLPAHNENGVPQTFLIKEEQSAGDGSLWYRVLLPMRPNGSTGWIPAADVDVAGLRHRLVVHLSALRLDLFEGARLQASFPIGVGTDETPTPGGEYYIKELLQPPDPNTIYGQFVFGLSGFSNVLLDYAGGGGVLGIHGTNEPESVGRRASHGCIRMRNEDVSQLASLLPLGTPVDVVGD